MSHDGVRVKSRLHEVPRKIFYSMSSSGRSPDLRMWTGSPGRIKNTLALTLTEKTEIDAHFCCVGVFVECEARNEYAVTMEEKDGRSPSEGEIIIKNLGAKIVVFIFCFFCTRLSLDIQRRCLFSSIVLFFILEVSI